MKTFDLLLLISYLSLLVGCETRPQSAAGPPQILVAAPLENVRSAALSELQTLGYLVVGSEPNLLTGDKDAGMAAAIFMGSRSDPRVTKRLRFILAQEGSAVRVSTQFTFAGCAGRDSREEDMMSARTRADLQPVLERIKAKAER
jgi:hypothetical protein